MIVSARIFANQITTTATKLGVALPKPFAAAIDQAHKLTAAAEAFGDPPGAVAGRAITVLLAGDDPTDDAELQRLVLRRNIADFGLRNAATDHADGLLAAAIVEHADAILSGWNKALAGDYEALTHAAERLSVPVLAAAETAELRRTGGLHIWSHALAANDRIDIAHTGFKAVVTALQVQHQHEHRALALTDASGIDSVNALATSEGHDPDAWTIARTGAPLSLATTAEFMARIADYTAAKQARQRALDNARREAGFDAIPAHKREALGLP
jgi:hypothetical protein